MKEYKPEDIRNIVLASHSTTGKTTLAEAMLFTAKVTKRLGKIDDGTSLFDYAKDEIERKCSINLSVAYFEYKDKLMNLIDTPGYSDFWGDTICGMRSVESCIIPIDADTGIQLGTETSFDQAKNNNLSIIFFVNKLKKSDIDFEKCLKELRETFGNSVVPFTVLDDKGNVVSVLDSLSADRQDDAGYKANLIETIAETDDVLTEKYLNDKPFTSEEIQEGIKQGIKTGKMIPVFVGNASECIGVEELLNSIADYLPGAGVPEDSKGLINQTPTIFIFKTQFGPHLGDLKYIRVFSGTLEAGSTLFNLTKNQSEKINQIYLVRGKEREEVERLTQGQIGMLVKLKNTDTGDTLGSMGLINQTHTISLEKIDFPTPQSDIAIVPKTKKDEEKVSDALSKIHAEDPTIIYKYDPETHQTVVSGLGDLHLNIVLERIKERFGVDVSIGPCKVHYRETITRSAEAEGKYKKQTGGHGQYGHCWVRLEPIEKGKGFEFVDAIKGGKIPSRFIPSVEKGLKEAMTKGFLANYPVVGIKATLYDGSFHSVDSSDIAFKIAATMAFKSASEKAGAILLEPILNLEIIVKEDFMGDVIGDLNARRSKVLGSEPKGKSVVIKALVPEAELHNYSATLRSITGGGGFFKKEFSNYEPVPKEIEKKVIEQKKKEEK